MSLFRSRWSPSAIASLRRRIRSLLDMVMARAVSDWMAENIACNSAVVWSTTIQHQLAHVCVNRDGGERLTEFMRQRGGEAPQQCHAFDMREFSEQPIGLNLRQTKPSDVGVRDNRATFAVQQWRRRQLIPLLCAFVIHHEARQIPTQDSLNRGRALCGLLDRRHRTSAGIPGR